MFVCRCKIKTKVRRQREHEYAFKTYNQQPLKTAQGNGYITSKSSRKCRLKLTLSLRNRRDTTLARRNHYLMNGLPNEKDGEIPPYFSRRAELLAEQGSILWGYSCSYPANATKANDSVATSQACQYSDNENCERLFLICRKR